VSTLELARPTVCSFPQDASTDVGRDAVMLAASAGLVLDPWQEFVIENALGTREDGKWAAFEVWVNVPRQNGKGGILEARALAGLFLLEERYIIWSAHNFDTSKESFGRLESLIRETPALNSQVAKYRHSHGEEGIELKNGARIRFRTRTTGGGRGFTADCVILDEAMFLNETFHWALLPTLSARSVTGNPQVWYTGSAADELVHQHAVVWARVRERGMVGNDPALAYFEWSAHSEEVVKPEDVTLEMLDDEGLWAAANPALGIRISNEHVGHELRSMDSRGFAVERLGVGAWPRTDGLVESVISIEDWIALKQDDSKLGDEFCIAFDVSPDRTKAAIAAAGRNQDGVLHVEIAEYLKGTGDVIQRLLEIDAEHYPDEIVCAAQSPAESLLEEAKEAGLKIRVVAISEHAQACGQLVDLVTDKELVHLGSAELATAVRGARTRPLGDAWAWSRKNSAVDISPLVAATLALSAAANSETDWEIHF
jgi:phage terminase large subunit-like protein